MPVGHNDRPKVKLEPQANGDLKVTWGPKKGPWGIFREDMIDNPAEVEIKEWWLYVATVVNPHNPVHGSKKIFEENVGTKTAMTISKSLLPQHKKVVAQVLGSFNSETISGETVIDGVPFIEGIYSDPAEIDIH